MKNLIKMMMKSRRDKRYRKASKYNFTSNFIHRMRKKFDAIGDDFLIKFN